MVFLRNQFTMCTVDDHSSGGQVLSCLNTMGDRHRYFVYDSKVAMCEYHMCTVILDRKDNAHNQIACSGAIMRFGDDKYYFNPLTPFGINFGKMLPMSRSAVDYFAVNVQYFFQSDVRSTFENDIMDINCTNDMRTCLTFTNKTLCFGNVEDTTIIHSTESLIHGIIISFLVGSLCYIFLRKEVKWFPLSFVFAFYIVPLVGIGMAYCGWFLSMSIPYLMGNAIVLFLFQFLYYPLRDLNEYITNKRINETIKNKY